MGLVMGHILKKITHNELLHFGLFYIKICPRRQLCISDRPSRI